MKWEGIVKAKPKDRNTSSSGDVFDERTTRIAGGTPEKWEYDTKNIKRKIGGKTESLDDVFDEDMDELAEMTREDLMNAVMDKIGQMSKKELLMLLEEHKDKLSEVKV
jgi:hypothetical protein|tara:strand:- start:419 stop:742 length:324 start_codon:yes stop_codon:yes gene_type:complete